MTIEVSPDTQQLVEQRLRPGDLPTPDEVVRIALTLLEQRDFLGHIDDVELGKLYPGFREKIDRGLAEADGGS